MGRRFKRGKGGGAGRKIPENPGTERGNADSKEKRKKKGEGPF